MLLNIVAWKHCITVTFWGRCFGQMIAYHLQRMLLQSNSEISLEHFDIKIVQESTYNIS